jgi:hypothetical protein
LSTHLRLGLPCGLFPSGFPTNILYALLVSPIRAKTILTFRFFLNLLAELNSQGQIIVISKDTKQVQTQGLNKKEKGKLKPNKTT